MNDTTTVGIEVRADGTQEAARDLAVVEASIRKVGKGLGEAAQYIGSAKLENPIAGLDELAAKCNVSSRHMQNLARMMREVERERAFRQLAQDANLSTLQLARLRAEMGDMRGALATLGNGFSSVKVAILAWAAAVAFGGKACLDAALQMDRLDKSYTSIYGSASAAQQQLSYLYDVSGRLGLQFQSTAEGAKTFFAAGKGSTLEKDLNSIFEAVSSAGAALSLSTDDMHGAFLALGQMISKGKVQAEELRGQLGERLPGAFQLAAKAMGMTTAALDKFMADGKLTAEELLPKLAKVLKDEYGAAAEEAAKGMQGSLNRLSTEWERLKASFVDSDTAVAGINALRVAVEGLQALFDALSEYSGLFKALAVGAGVSAGVAALVASLKTCLPLLALFKGALDANAALTFAGGIMGIQKAMIALNAAVIGHPILALAAVIGTASAAIYYYAEQADAATQAQKALNAAQELSPEISKRLSENQEIAAKELEARVAASKQQLADLESAMTNIMVRLSSSDAYHSSPWKYAKVSLDEYIESVMALRRKTAETGDFKALLDGLKRIEMEAQAAGKDTDQLKKSVAEARSVADLGIKLSITIEGWQNLVKVQKWMQSFATTYSVSISDVSPNSQKTDWREQRDEATHVALQKINEAFTKTDAGRLESLYAETKEYKAQLTALDSMLLTDGQRAEAAEHLNALLNDRYKKIDGILKKGKSSSEAAANRAAKALAAYDEELAKLTQSSRELEQVKIEEKLAKIAKDAKLPAAEMEKLRKAMEQEADFKWMQDILSYADPAAAAVAKVDKEYEAFLRNVEYLKKTDPAKYTQLMTKAETEHEKALRKAERASKEQNEHLQEKLSFYKELEEMSGAFGLSLEVQNRLLDEQMEIFRDADIPENLIQTWRQYKDLMNSHEWADGAQRAFLQYRADATDAAKGAEEAFSGLYSGMDSGWKSAWEQMIETGKVSLSSFRSVFASFLADLMHMAITRPITVQIAGVVSGMLGTGGVAYAAGGNSGSGGIGLGNLPFSSLLPDSWTSGVSSFLSYELPGTAPGISGLYGPTMGGGNLASGLSLGSALMYGGLGSLGYSLLGGALGLPQNKYSGITSGLGAGLGAWGASAALSGTALGATLGSAVPVVGTVIGAALGGLASSLFGGGKKTHPSVYTNVVDASLFGSDWEALMTQGAWTDRASVSDAAGIFKGLGEVANTTASSIMGFAQALPEEYQAQVLARLNAETVSFGRGSTAGRKGVTDYGPSTWNFQFHDEEQLQEVINTAGEDIQRVMLNALQRAMVGTDLSSMLAVDLSSTEGLDKAIQAINAINTVTEATANIKEPLSEMEQQAKAARAQLDEWTESMRSLGVNADYAGKLMEDYRHAYIDNVIESLDESLHPLSAYEQAVKAANEAVDQRKKALEIIGATESQLAQVEAMRAEVVKQATEEMLRSFDQSVAQRWAAVNGNADEVGRAISQANELRETIRQFGEGSAQVAELLKLHAAETAKAAQDAAKSEYDSLRAQMDALEQQRVQLQQQAIHEQINAINEQLSAAKTLKSTWEGLDKSLGQSRYNLFAGSANLDAENRLGTVQAEFRWLSGLALGGDSDAAGQLAGVGNSLLDLVKQTAGTEEEYLDAFWAVNAQLKAAQEAAGAQGSAADKQLEALQGQLDVQNAALKQLQGQSATLEEIEKQIAELRPLLDAAGQKAGVKAFARGGLAMPGWSLVGEEGPELVNFSQPGRVYTAADTAALFRSVTPRAADTDSGSREEVKALRREVYQLRRDMLISMSEIARFSRRTSDMVEAWDAEGMPGVRA
ncbi:tape measure protein [uncultured Bilophila sp.]|uniref:tape measure protein n=2 Tax=Bilophila TaxID=35832 RepID=UPI0025955B00|nr:tape measure protein [uncultured Bilophila sp.]